MSDRMLVPRQSVVPFFVLIHDLERQRAELIAKLNGIRHYIGVIQNEGRITGFDETLWLNTVDRLWIKPDGTMRFEFKGGPAIEG